MNKLVENRGGLKIKFILIWFIPDTRLVARGAVIGEGERERENEGNE